MKGYIIYCAFTLLIASGVAAAETNASSVLFDATMAPVAKADLLPLMPQVDSTMNTRHPRLRIRGIDASRKNKSATTNPLRRQLAGQAWETLSKERPGLLVVLLLLGSITAFLILIFLFVILPFQLFVWVWYWCCTRTDPGASQKKVSKTSGEASPVAATSSIQATIDSKEERDHDAMVDIDL